MAHQPKLGSHPALEQGTEWLAERRSVLKWSSAALMGVLAFGGKIPGLQLSDALAQTPGGADSKMSGAVDLGEGDVGVLNYAYALEQLEAAFYTQALKTPFGGMESGTRAMLETIRNHEIAHRELFKAALKKGAIPDLEVDFTKIDFNSRDSVLSTAKTFEDLGVAAYNGAGKLLKKADYLVLAGKIVSVEARHAAAIRDMISSGTSTTASGGSDNSQNAGMNGSGMADMDAVDDKGLDMALMPSEVLPKAAPFIKTNVTAKNLK